MISFDDYINPKTRTWMKVAGWTEHGAFTAIKYFDSYQKSNSISGDLVEIGVHHGQFFIAMALLSDGREQVVAVDVFDWQHLNIDKSGRGDLDIFKGHISNICPDKNIIIRQADSLAIKISDKTDEQFGKRKYRIFHIDGGHTPEHVVNDLRIAEACVVEGGVVIADDFLHPKWIGVTEGIFKYIADGASPLLPFAFGNNKMYFCFDKHFDHYYDTINGIGKTDVAGRKPVQIDGLKSLYISLR